MRGRCLGFLFVYYFFCLFVFESSTCNPFLFIAFFFLEESFIVGQVDIF